MIRLLFLLIGGTVLAGQSLPFEIGEKLEYSAQFNVLPVGRACLSVLARDTIDGVPTYQVNYTARTGDLADRLFKIRDKIDIWFDERSMYTYRVEKSISEGKYRRHAITRIDYRDSLAVSNHDTISITQPARDPYSLFFYLRTLAVEPGQTLDLVTFDNNKFSDFQLQVIGIEEVQVPAGNFSCLVIKPFNRQRTLFKNEGDMEVWLSTDERRLPVQIHLRLKYGTLVLKLKTISG